MKYSVKHGLDDPSRVRTVVEKAYAAYEERLRDYRPSFEWVGDRQGRIGFTAMSQKVTAQVEYDDQELRVDGKVPFLLKPFESKIEGVLSRELDTWLAKARKGEI